MYITPAFSQLNPGRRTKSGVGDPCACLHVIGDVYGVDLVREESVAEMHALFLPAGVDGHDSGVNDHHHADDQVVFLQHRVGHQGD